MRLFLLAEVHQVFQRRTHSVAKKKAAKKAVKTSPKKKAAKKTAKRK
jgi:hypothetical protein